MQICDPQKLPGTKLAHEHHGGKAGRIWRLDKREVDGVIILVPRRCPHCMEIYVYNKRDEPLCPICGAIQGDEPKIEPEEIKRYRRLKSAKKARIIYRC